MSLYLFLEMLHVVGATVLLGTGAGLAFFMLMAYRTREPRLIAHTAAIVVVADALHGDRRRERAPAARVRSPLAPVVRLRLSRLRSRARDHLADDRKA